MIRKRNIYHPDKPFRLSRSKVELYLNCPKCFYLDIKKGLKRPSIAPYNLNLAIDSLLKKEFDLYRKTQTAHPLMEYYDINAIPFEHEDLDQWRNNFKGIEVPFKNTNLILFGAVDDIWESQEESLLEEQKLIVVDYKATNAKGRVTLGEYWKQGYKRQLEFYQWLLSSKGYSVSETGYFVYCNAKTSNEKGFFGNLKFDIDILNYKGDYNWINSTISAIDELLKADRIPESIDRCEHCQYRLAANKLESI